MALCQVLGEYEDRLQAAQLDLKIKLPEEHISILADSRHLQRIFDNLILNMAKHGQPGTRAYVNLEKEGILLLRYYEMKNWFAHFTISLLHRRVLMKKE